MAKTTNTKDTLDQIEEGVISVAKKAGDAIEEVLDDVAEGAEKIKKAVVAKLEEVADEGDKIFSAKIEKTRGKKEDSEEGKEVFGYTEGDKKKNKKAPKKDTEEEKHPESTKESKLEALKKKAKALEGKFAKEDSKTLKEKVTGEKEEKKNMLVPIEDYLKASIHLGTRVITPDMRKYVYRRRADGLAVFNTSLLDDEVRKSAEYLAKFAPQDMIVVCKREAGWKAAELFAKTFGIKFFTKKYPSGVLTNTILENFFETELVFITDPWLDKNALKDANRIKIPVMSICDTNNFTAGINQILPGNNKSWKSLGMIFYLLTKLYAENRKIDVAVPPIQDFIEGWDGLQPPT